MTGSETVMLETWENICTNPAFSNVNYSFEITPEGQIILSPTFTYHSQFQGRIIRLLDKYASHGEASPEVPVVTQMGLFEVDVAWVPKARVEAISNQKAVSPAPELCIEVWSDSNTPQEFERKRNGLFQAGAEEFWLVDRNGKIAFYLKTDPHTAVTMSKLVPGFPQAVPLRRT